MSHYLILGSYSNEGWAAQIKSPQTRIEAIRPVVERLGGSIESGYLAFGEYDLVILVQMPDNISMAALSLAASAGGALSTLKTVPLLTIDEGLEALAKAGDVGYRPPGQ